MAIAWIFVRGLLHYLMIGERGTCYVLLKYFGKRNGFGSPRLKTELTGSTAAAKTDKSQMTILLDPIGN